MSPAHGATLFVVLRGQKGFPHPTPVSTPHNLSRVAWAARATSGQHGPRCRPHGGGPGSARFAGATYDFTSHYRAARVFKFFEEQKLTPAKLRELNQHHIEILPGSTRKDAIGGFLAIPASDGRTTKIQKALRNENIWTDYRGDTLRLGPAPYVADAQLAAGTDALARRLRHHG